MLRSYMSKNHFKSGRGNLEMVSRTVQMGADLSSKGAKARKGNDLIGCSLKPTCLSVSGCPEVSIN